MLGEKRSYERQQSAAIEEKQQQQHMDHISTTVWCISLSLSKDAMNTSDAKSAVDKEWDTLKNLPTWSVKKVKPWSEVLQQAKKDGRSVHFASFVDLCHLKHSELAKHFENAMGATSRPTVQTEHHSRGMKHF